jgi:hypothetical protein
MGHIPVQIKPGDIIICNRIFYEHYGIYTGKGRVIHYAARDGDFGADVKVRETSLKDFANNDKCHVLPSTGNIKRAKHFSPEETVRRARSRIDEKDYNLFFNNCEHFALWCKYGKNRSVQVEKAAGAVILLSAAVLIAHIAINIDNEG